MVATASAGSGCVTHARRIKEKMFVSQQLNRRF
jgi:hypothetical protein